MPSPIPTRRLGGHPQGMPADPQNFRRAPLALIAVLMAVTLSLAACGDDEDASTQDARRDTNTTQATDRATPSEEEVEREARAIAEELKELQRDVVRSGRTLVEGSPEERDAAERELRAQARRAERLAERAERDVVQEARGSSELREAARDTERGLAELRRYADQRRRAGLRRANAELEAGEKKLRSFADSLREDTPEEDARRALDELRDRVPDIPAP